MVDCPACGYGRNIKKGQNKCNICGTDITILQELDSLPEVYYEKALELIEEKRMEEAVQMLNAAEGLDMKFLLPSIKLGELYTENHDYKKAIEAFERAAKADTNNRELAEKIKQLKMIQEDEDNRIKKCEFKKRFAFCLVSLAAIILAVIFTSMYIRGESKKIPSDAVVTQAPPTVAAPADTHEASSAQAYEKIKEAINACPELVNMDIFLNAEESVVSIKGTVPSEVHKRLLIKIAESSSMGIKINEEIKVVSPVVPVLRADNFDYIVKKGDSLSKIAFNIYGNYDLWEIIYNANKDRILKCNEITEGLVLKIPIIEVR